MTATKRILLAFHQENLSIVQKVQEVLQTANYDYELLPCSDQNRPLYEQLTEYSDPVLMFISDNYLKCAGCMQNGLVTLQSLSTNNRVLPVVIDGMYTEEDGKQEVVPTRFERVSDVIQYLNYWQDEYLNLRRKKRNSEVEDQAVNHRLKVVRGISSEVGEYLRHLRVTNHRTWEQFEYDHYQALFAFVRDPETHDRLKQQGFRVEKTLVEPELPAEEVSEETMIDLSDIPGMELLPTFEPESEPEEEEKEPAEATQENEPLQEASPDFINAIQNAQQDLEKELEEVEDEDMGAEQEPAEEDFGEEGDSDLDIFFGDETEEEEGVVGNTPQEEGSHQEEAEEDVAAPLEQANQLFEEDEVEEEEEEEEDEDEDIESIIESAASQIAAGKVELGLNQLEEAVEQYPSHPDLRYRYALALLQHARNAPAAQDELEALVALDPDHDKGLFLLGELAEMNHHFEEARDYYKQCTKANKKNAEAYYRLGLLLSNHFKGEEKAAAKAFKRSFKANKYLVDAYYQYAILLQEKLDKPDKAARYFKKTLKYQPDHPFANYDLALHFHQQEAYEEAYDYYQKSIQINPELQTPENDAAFYWEAPSEPMLVESEHQEEPVEATEPQVAVQKSPAGQTQLKVLITGATSGIGRATAEVFASHGHHLLLTGRRTDRLNAIKEELSERYGVEVETYTFDVRDLEAVKATIDNSPETWKDLDILINNAGLAKGLAPIHQGSIDHWETMIDTNIKGLLYMTRAISPYMVDRQQGHIINVGSIAGKEVYPQGNVYCATKFAVDALTKAMRIDLHQYGIRVSQVSPGHVEETEFAKVRFDGDEQKAKIYQDFNPLTSTDVGEIIYFMATRPAHVNILDMVATGTQQASATIIDRSGRNEEEE
jgi:NADP-dependent 3-hydroxy acid dehydrogenase YdfG/Tfp pilus assembly protein PilF